MTQAELLNICNEIVHAEKTLNEAVDKLLAGVGVLRKEASDGKFSKKVDTE